MIYMISVLSDISMKRAGFDPALRSQIATAWRAEDYHRAGELIPDELLDAFILCGTVKEVAARAAAYHDAGMDVPLLQPILLRATKDLHHRANTAAGRQFPQLTTRENQIVALVKTCGAIVWVRSSVM